MTTLTAARRLACRPRPRPGPTPPGSRAPAGACGPRVRPSPSSSSSCGRGSSSSAARRGGCRERCRARRSSGHSRRSAGRSPPTSTCPTSGTSCVALASPGAARRGPDARRQFLVGAAFYTWREAPIGFFARRAPRPRPGARSSSTRGSLERAFVPVRHRQPDDPDRRARADHRVRASGRA